MNNQSVEFFFIALNSALYLIILIWCLRYYIIPLIRTSLIMQDEKSRSLLESSVDKRAELIREQEFYSQQEREMARLRACVERWAGALSQRAANVEKETRELAFRYKSRCENNARARVTLDTNNIIIKQVLKNAHETLMREYAQPLKQYQYIEKVCAKIRQKDMYDRA